MPIHLPAFDLMLGAAVCALGAMVQSTLGFGLALVSVPFLVLIDPALVPGPFLLASLVLALLMVLRDRVALDLFEIRAAILGLLGGTLIGAAALLVVPKDDLPAWFGALILLAIGLSALGVRIPIGRASLLAAGVIGGLMGTMGGLHGPAMALLFQAERGERVRAMLGAFFIAGYAISLLGLGAVGLFGWRETVAGLGLTPGIVIGWALAPQLIRRLDPATLRPSILIVSGAAAVLLLVGA